ncbi:hypothetical protein K488DRAFT_36847, partial [Vararia minispora EC-137]
MYSPIHKASLVSPAFHSPALLELVEQNLSRPVIDYVIDVVVETVDFALGRPSQSSRGRSTSRHTQQSAFASLVHNVLTRAEVEMPVVLSTLAYLDRAKPHLHIALEEWANERVFLGALIVASKYTNDSSLKNIHWAMCTGIFGKRDIGRIEREMLAVLDWDLNLSEADVLAHHLNISRLIPSMHHSPSSASGFLSPPLSSSSSVTSSSGSSPLPALRHSPASTNASLSPQTPQTLVESMQIDIVKSAHSREHSTELSVPSHSKDSKHHHNHPTLRLLRNIAFPRHH